MSNVNSGAAASRFFAGKAAIVTGASSGFGRLIARTLGAHGMELWITGRRQAELEKTAASITGAPVHCAAFDLATPGALADLVTRVGREHPHLYALVNNAGLMHPEPIAEGNAAHWRAMFDVNVVAPADGCRAAIAVMRAHGRPGHLVNFSSIAARTDAGRMYGASKLALELVGRSLREELEMDDIRVTTLVPGGFGGTELGREITPGPLQALMKNAAAKNCALDGPNVARALADPQHVANTVLWVLQQPPDVNISEVVVRPPVSITF